MHRTNLRCAPLCTRGTCVHQMSTQIKVHNVVLYTLVVHNLVLYLLGGAQDNFACSLRTIREMVYNAVLSVSISQQKKTIFSHLWGGHA